MPGLQGFQKVHVVSVGFEVDRVVDPVRRIGADRVIVVCNPEEKDAYLDMLNEVIRRLEEFLPTDAIILERIPIFDLAKLISGLGRIVRHEKEEGNWVFMNISVGTRLYGAAAHLAALMFGAIPFYAEVEGYRTNPEDFYEGRRPVGISYGVKEIYKLPELNIEPPPEHLVKALCILKEMGGQAKQSQIIREVRQTNFTGDISQGGAVDQSAHQKFRRSFLEPLVERKWVNKEGKRAGAQIILTELGEWYADIFGPMYELV